MSSGTLVSVVVPTYDRAAVLPRAIDSALAQDVDGLEVVVVDDGSTDHTGEVVAAYDDEAVTYVFQENAGANAARNRGIAEAAGEYVSFLDADDEFVEGHLAAVLEALRNSPTACRGAVTADARVEDGRVQKVKRPGEAGGGAGSARATGERLTLADARAGNVVGGFSSTTFERGVFEDVGTPDESMPAAQDYEFFLRYLGAYDLVCVEDVLVRSHVEDDSISVDPERKRRANDAILARHGDVVSDRRRARGRFAEGVAAARSGDVAAARRAFATALRLRPTEPRYYYFYAATFVGDRGFERCYRLPYRLRALYHRGRLRAREWIETEDRRRPTDRLEADERLRG